MKTDIRKTIAIVIGNSISSYSSDLMEGFLACAKKEDVNLIFLTGPHLPRYCKDILNGSFAWDYEYQFHTIYDYVHYIKPDAIIVAYGLLSRLKYVPDVDKLVKGFGEIPCLVLGDQVDDPKVPYLTGGNYHGMKENVEHLIKVHGYKKIGFVAGPRRNFDSNQRMQAYKDALTECGLPVEESLMIHGDYTELVDAEVECLLDRNPGIEAIVFANDTMAKAGYRVCAARNLVIGHDIAITGYDDTDTAKILEPPLTSVAHSSFLFSYRAVQAALKLCNGELPDSEDLQAQFHKRASCGCKVSVASLKPAMTMEEIKEYIQKRIAAVTEELFSTIPYEEGKARYRMLLEQYFFDVIDMVFVNEEENASFEVLLRYLKQMCENTFVSKRLLIEYIEQILSELIVISNDKWKQAALSSVSAKMQQYIHSEEINKLQLEILHSDRKNWFIPSFTMDLVSGKLDLQEQMMHIMTRLKAMDVKSSYILFFREFVLHKKEEKMQFPETIYLKAYFDATKMVCYPHKEVVPIRMHQGFTEWLPQDEPHFYTAFPLFSGEEQYGMILCEPDQKEYMSMLICSMQIASLMRIIYINRRELVMKQKLEEKNRILSLISANDELTKLLNRRGFMERVIEEMTKNAGKRACLVFADIDHLKEINDCFGHAAGDFAIITVADYLRNCMPKNAVIARIGGDEYVSLIILEEEEKDFCGNLTQRLKDYAKHFNESCKEPYYVEMSAGVYEFTCDPSLDITEAMRHSDEILYEEKKKRRKTIKKL